jgi:hypothetical protein
MVRTGKRLKQLNGEDILAYSHLARMSRRHTRDHLAWELLIALGPLAGVRGSMNTPASKCRFLQVDPAQAGRIEDMAANAEERLDEARNHQWLGEVSALEESLVHLRRRRDGARRFGDQVIPRSFK